MDDRTKQPNEAIDTPSQNNTNRSVRRSRPSSKWAAIAVAGFVVLGIGYYVRQKHVEPPAASTGAALPSVVVAQPIVRNIADHARFLGQFSAVDFVEIRAQVGGILSEIAFADGQLVKKGDLLFVIDTRPYEIKVQQAAAQVAIAEAELSLARKQLVRAQELKLNDFGTAETVDQRMSDQSSAIARLEAARQNLEDAKLDLQYCRVYAPFSGKISNHRVSVGSLVTGSRTGAGGTTLLTTLVKLDPIYLDFDMSEDDFLQYARAKRSGQETVRFSLSDEKRAERTGTLDFIDNAINRSSGTIHARATVSNPDLLLSPGAFARLEVTTGSPKPSILIPEASLSLDQSQHFAMTVDEAGIVVAKEVEPGSLFGGLRAIKHGLAETDRVVIDGLPYARAGQKVAIEIGTIAASADDFAQ